MDADKTAASERGGAVKHGPGPLKPWHFLDGTPVNNEQIRKIVNAAIPHKCPEPPPIPHELIRETAEYFAKKIESHLIRYIAAEFALLHKGRIVGTDDSALAARRTWRRNYQRQYRLRTKVFQTT